MLDVMAGRKPRPAFSRDSPTSPPWSPVNWRSPAREWPGSKTSASSRSITVVRAIWWKALEVVRGTRCRATRSQPISRTRSRSFSCSMPADAEHHRSLHAGPGQRRRPLMVLSRGARRRKTATAQPARRWFRLRSTSACGTLEHHNCWCCHNPTTAFPHRVDYPAMIAGQPITNRSPLGSPICST